MCGWVIVESAFLCCVCGVCGVSVRAWFVCLFVVCVWCVFVSLWLGVCEFEGVCIVCVWVCVEYVWCV